MTYRGAMTRPNDYSGAVVSTAIGLVVKMIGGFAVVWACFFIFVLVFGTEWGWLAALVLAGLVILGLLLAGESSRKARQAHEEEHRRKYGREPRPW